MSWKKTKEFCLHSLERIHLLHWLLAPMLPPLTAWLFFPSAYLASAWEKHPQIVISVSLLICIPSAILVIIFFKWIRARALLGRVGAVLTAAYPTTDKNSAAAMQVREQVLARINDDLRSSSHLRLLGCTGFNTFSRPPGDVGAKEAFLYDVLDKAGTNKQIDVVLLHPDSKYLAARAKQCDVDVGQLQTEINTSIKRCAELHRQGVNVNCYLFKDRPLVWKLIISDNFAWQQAYPDDNHVEFTGINLFQRVGLSNGLKVDNSNSLYAPFLKLFDLLKETGCEKKDLSTVAI